MEKNFDELAEAIADAKAQESVETVNFKAENVIYMPASEYIDLKIKERNLDKLIDAIEKELFLGYSMDYLGVRGDEILDAYKVLYTARYDETLKKLKEEKNAELEKAIAKEEE